MLVRRDGKVANGALHPALSCLFRVTDGLRMTMHQMLFVPIGEPALPPDTPVTSRDVLAYAERNYSFYGDHGVCAGPQVMIEHFFAVLVDGAGPDLAPHSAPLAPELEDALDALGDAIDYGLLALQAHAAAFSVWPAMARTYEAMAAICEEWAEAGEPGVLLLRDRLRGHMASLKESTYLATEAWRASRDQAYADMFAQCAAGHSETRTESLPAQLAARMAPRDEGLARRLRLALAAALGGAEGDSPHAHRLADCLMRYAETEQALVRVACGVQWRINAMLGRPAPRQPFAASQLNIHNLLQRSGRKDAKQEDAKRLPYLWDELEAALGIRLDASEDEIGLSGTDTAPACGATGFRRQTSPV
jgi:hypothetical protein